MEERREGEEEFSHTGRNILPIIKSPHFSPNPAVNKTFRGWRCV
jgi:hypothetical protein